MTAEHDLDRFIRGGMPVVDTSDQRLERLIAGTLARVPPRPGRQQTGLALLVPLLGRYAVPMATALMLGLVVGRHVLPVEQPVSTGLFPTSSTVLAGF